ncbi:glycoside hydrolase family 71/99-like protein [uncultured Draconibacterium sp.]|uniref:glycoside hydrolase family 71/99-like protein n=1 Tax=uncultured Draconibacterium sp. TaxID=1573823 RepID=UPI0029C85971|nr:glycoside hydrolase family 71/99-like protein [uncultured Draconibacterium sp.]
MFRNFINRISLHLVFCCFYFIGYAQPNNNIEGKILCGYQGWFNAEGDGSGLGWKHYTNKGQFNPGLCSIDLWPDMSEYTEDEKFPTAFKNADGSVAEVFSSAHPKSVDRHFDWMKDYGIDGVFIQRFVTNFRRAELHKNLNQVFDNCYNASENHNRLISVMYDLSGSKSELVENTKKDWIQLVDKYGLTDPTKNNVLTYKAKPVVAIWGVGFNDGRQYTLEQIKELINFFKNDPKYGGCSVLLGVPTGWRTLSRDCMNNPKVHELIKMADIVHPWTPGRYKSIEEADEHKRNWTEVDNVWCEENGLLYMPVVFPGFSWHNLRLGQTPLNQIPRENGEFLWRQYYNAVSSGVKTIYVAMFDEMDEGTCIFKCTNNPPVGKSTFATYEELPSDYYLWLTGTAGKMLRKEISLSKVKPEYPNK